MTQKQAYYGLINKLGYVGHHINNVDDFPDWAGDARNIFFLKKGAGEEHVMLGHLGHYKNSSTGMLIDREAMIRMLNLGDGHLVTGGR